MAIQPASLVASAAFLQDVKNTQTKKATDEEKASGDALEFADEVKASDEKTTAVAVEIKATETSETRRRVDIKIDDEDRHEEDQQFNAVAANREAPVPQGAQNQRPGSNLDISV